MDKKRLKSIVGTVILACTWMSVLPTYSQNKCGFTSWLPAPSADHALLIGNGTMGAMVFGYPHNETIILNHSSLYLPTGMPKQPINQVELLPEIRELILEGNGKRAAELPVEQSLKEGYGGQIWSDPYIPAFDIKIKTTPENIIKYKRSVDYTTGEAIVHWEQTGNSFVRKQFISRADSMMVLKISATEPFDVEFIIDRRPVAWNQWDYINSNFKSTDFYSRDNYLIYSSEFKNQWEGNIAGYYGLGKILPKDGEIKSSSNSVSVSGTTETLLLLKIENFKTGSNANIKELQQALDTYGNADYEALLKRHKKIHTELFNRVTFSINEEEENNLDAEIMMQKAKKKVSTDYIEKLFYASRYNILSATGDNPPNLQGIWGDSWQPPWSSDYTHDGNLQVAISSFMVSNMPELTMAYFDYHDARLQYYRDNAKKLYGCRGIQIPSHSSSHGWNVHFDKTWCLTFWNGGAAWASHFYYDYWLYTQDNEFLKSRAYPFMKEAALFYEDFLTLGENGKYIFNPSYSPENNPGNNPSQATINATMDVMLAKELFRNIISAGKQLGEEQNIIKKWKNILSNLPEYEVDPTGTLREWLWPGYTENHHHRHISHLIGLYDRVDPEIAANPKLLEGAKKAVKERMKIRSQENGGIMVFGLVQMAWVAANLGDAELVSEIINWLSSQYWSNSLSSYHDPNGLFNMDLSGGYQTVIIKTLVNSEPGKITLLPAKPKNWKTGTITGLKLRGQVELNKLSWNERQFVVTLTSPINQSIELQFPPSFNQVHINGEKESVEINKKTGVATIQLKSNKTTEIKIEK